MPNKMLLCVDINETILNYDKELDQTVFDFNGSNKYNDPDAWINVLTEIKNYCEANDFQLIVQIITSKSDIDYEVRAVFKALQPFLLPRNQQGAVTLPFFDPTEGYTSQSSRMYYLKHEKMEKKWVFSSKNSPSGSITDDDFLPPIHICRYNVIGQREWESMDFDACMNNKSYSKAKVLDHLYFFFNQEIPREHIWLVDDLGDNLKDSTQAGYSTVSTEALAQHQAGKKEDRTQICQQILQTLKGRIKDQVDSAPNVPSDKKQPSSLTELNLLFMSTQTQMHFAVKNRDLQQVKILDPNLINTVDLFNGSPLLYAAFLGYDEIVSYLIEQGATVHLATQLPQDASCRQNHGNTPLDWAILGRHALTIDILLRAGAVPQHLNCDSRYGRTALDWAILYEHIKIIPVLIHAGSMPRLNDVQVNESINMELLKKLVALREYFSITELIKLKPSLLKPYNGETLLDHVIQCSDAKMVHFLVTLEEEITGQLMDSQRIFKARYNWSRSKTEPNPFHVYYRVYWLENIKMRMIQRIKNNTASNIFFLFSSHLTQERKDLSDLKEKIQHASFNLEMDDPNKTAEDVLKVVIDDWEQQWKKKENTSERIVTILNSIKWYCGNAQGSEPLNSQSITCDLSERGTMLQNI